LDAATGRELWRFWTVPGPGELGGDTWPSPNDPDPTRTKAYLQGGATVWQTPAIDPDLGLIYFSTGQPGPNAIGNGANRPGDNLFSSSIVALHLDGTYAWHFQQVRHDVWDFDCPSPVVLFDQVYDGVMHKGIAEACKTGWLYILDRTNGKPLIGILDKPVEQESRTNSAATQPFRNAARRSKAGSRSASSTRRGTSPCCWSPDRTAASTGRRCPLARSLATST